MVCSLFILSAPEVVLGADFVFDVSDLHALCFFMSDKEFDRSARFEDTP